MGKEGSEDLRWSWVVRNSEKVVNQLPVDLSDVEESLGRAEH